MLQINQLNLLLIGFITFCGISSFANGKIINCYYSTWAQYRQGEGRYTAQDIDPNLCTHLSYSFFGLNSNSGKIYTLDSYLADDLGQIAEVVALKQKNPNFKVVLVVGGWNECDSDKYSRVAASPQLRRNFIDSAVSLIQQYGFDGFDLDWEYPVTRHGTLADKDNFVTLLSELKAALSPLGKELGVAVAAGTGIASQAYNIPGIAAYVDYINVMTYDFASYGDGIVGFNAPLDGQGSNNVRSAINYWLEQGAPQEKLVLGLAFYGRTFKLANPQRYNLGDQVVGPLPGGPITAESGYYGYHEICKLKNSYNYEWSSESSVPFLHKDTEYISYDNVKSLELKVDLSNSLNLAGVMIWSIETDDFRNNCGDGESPLLHAVHNRIFNANGPSLARKEDEQSQAPQNYVQPVATQNYVQPVAPQISPPYSPAITGNCPDGLYPHPSECGQFIQCGNNIAYEQHCPAGLHFDGQQCNYPNLANCQH